LIHYYHLAILPAAPGYTSDFTMTGIGYGYLRMTLDGSAL
jgi:hypothetical protein